MVFLGSTLGDQLFGLLVPLWVSLQFFKSGGRTGSSCFDLLVEVLINNPKIQAIFILL
jgi:hypothetical protein